MGSLSNATNSLRLAATSANQTYTVQHASKKEKSTELRGRSSETAKAHRG
eukprot:TRINITY_DN10034_c0_g1_i1.p3 TRINITY_DN10034_c0_g1~~TRINITY_DN10034_c0_g1_i1.p3  ORF type:complete len:50 (+),score=24.49 TRINITY_DN10034_c0_g1_i1:219-368(+)